MNDKYKCSKCDKEKDTRDFHEAFRPDRERTVCSACKECRSDTYFEKRYPDNKCAMCLKHRKVINSNKVCKNCNEETSLRECNVCKQILPILLSFYGNRRACKSCQ